MPAPVLQTERLTLRPHERRDWEPMAEFLGSEAARNVGGPFDRRASWSSFAADVGTWDLLGCGAWAAVERASGTLVGQVGMNRPPHFPEAEIGWLIFPPHQRRGFGREAAWTARDFAFRDLGWSTAVSYIDPANAASIALALSLGCVLDPSAPRVTGDEGDLVFCHPASS